MWRSLGGANADSVAEARPATEARAASAQRVAAGRPVCTAGTGVASDYAAALLRSLGCEVARCSGAPDPDPALEWARSGAMALSGALEGAPRLAPGPLAACARGAAKALEELAAERWPGELDAPALLGERAALIGLHRRGAISPGGSCRLLRAADGWIAVNLPRPDDLALLPAWLGEGRSDDPWARVAQAVSTRPADEVVGCARGLGLAAAVAGAPATVSLPWFRVGARGRGTPRSVARAPVVFDLSSLWAGPLCAQLLALAGARVVKVESAERPDGARFGVPEFFDLLNAGKESVTLAFTQGAGRAALRALIERADIVVESARPRALEQLGINAGELVEGVPGLTWVSLTGYGRREPGGGWIAFGDDAAAAAGALLPPMGDGERPHFCGDAIADPLSGIHAALAGLASFDAGGGFLLDLALRDVVAHALAFPAHSPEARVERAGEGWEVVVGARRQRVLGPRARAVRERARPLGADTAAVLAEFGVAC